MKNNNLQNFDDNLLASLESLNLLFDILHDSSLGLQYVQEGLALVSLCHLLGEIESFILELKQLLVVLKLLQPLS